MIEYCEGEGRVDINFTAEVAPHVLALRTHFTTYKLKQAALRSIYAWRLFECLQSWRDKGQWKPSIEEFMTAMALARNSVRRTNLSWGCSEFSYSAGCAQMRATTATDDHRPPQAHR